MREAATQHVHVHVHVRVRGCNPVCQVSFMSPGQALVEIHPSRKRGFDDYVHAALLPRATAALDPRRVACAPRRRHPSLRVHLSVKASPTAARPPRCFRPRFRP